MNKRYLIACLQHPAPHMRHPYFYTGNDSNGYPPPWSWRTDCGLSFYEREIAEKWIKYLVDSGMRTNYDEPIDGTLYAMYVQEINA